MNGMSRKDSDVLKGVAVLLMLYHHMFAIPDRLNCNYVSLIGGANLEQELAYFGKICVAIFAFVSGYGISAKTESYNFKECISTAMFQLLSFMKKYWLVFTIFVPIRYLILDNPNVGVLEFLFSCVGFSDVYNGEWWYVRQYIIMLAAFPIISWFFQGDRKCLVKKWMAAMTACVSCGVCLLVLPWAMDWVTDLADAIHARRTLIYLLIFAEGMICNQYKVLSGIGKDYLNWKGKLKAALILCIFIWVRVSVVRTPQDHEIDVLVTVPIIYGTVVLLKGLNKVSDLLLHIGRYSVYIWLTHTFYLYYYFQKLITFSCFSLTMYLTLLCVSYLTAFVLCRIEIIIKSWRNLKT